MQARVYCYHDLPLLYKSWAEEKHFNRIIKDWYYEWHHDYVTIYEYIYKNIILKIDS